MLLLPLLLPLLAARAARAAYCDTVETGVRQGRVGVHMETLRPDQRRLRLRVPPVCAEQNGMVVMACETASLSAAEAMAAVERGAGGAGGAAGERGVVEREEDAPRVAVAGRRVTVTRSAAVAPAGFAALYIELYCN